MSTSMCEASLDEDTKEYFHRLVVFDYGTLIPVEALVTVWDVYDELVAKDIMMSEWFNVYMSDIVYVHYCERVCVCVCVCMCVCMCVFIDNVILNF